MLRSKASNSRQLVAIVDIVNSKKGNNVKVKVGVCQELSLDLECEWNEPNPTDDPRGILEGVSVTSSEICIGPGSDLAQT